MSPTTQQSECSEKYTGASIPEQKIEAPLSHVLSMVTDLYHEIDSKLESKFSIQDIKWIRETFSYLYNRLKSTSVNYPASHLVMLLKINMIFEFMTNDEFISGLSTGGK